MVYLLYVETTLLVKRQTRPEATIYRCALVVAPETLRFAESAAESNQAAWEGLPYYSNHLYPV